MFWLTSTKACIHNPLILDFLRDVVQHIVSSRPKHLWRYATNCHQLRNHELCRKNVPSFNFNWNTDTLRNNARANPLQQATRFCDVYETPLHPPVLQRKPRCCGLKYLLVCVLCTSMCMTIRCHAKRDLFVHFSAKSRFYANSLKHWIQSDKSCGHFAVLSVSLARFLSSHSTSKRYNMPQDSKHFFSRESDNFSRMISQGRGGCWLFGPPNLVRLENPGAPKTDNLFFRTII